MSGRKDAKVPPLHNAYKLQGKKVPSSIPVSEHEVYVMDLKTDKKTFNLKGPDGEGIDMSEIQAIQKFWETISLPPPTAFYKNKSRISPIITYLLKYNSHSN